ncbi:MAG: hypothetical protein NZ899_12415 [Thermoguttaceae bacterium]|nr:hypothetical protein [Thermoguttaceae bacterium]MDW8078464.1 hypothetical protein [Thermoguttaceae bacterium]
MTLLALIRYEFREARLQLGISSIILVAFAWLFVWLISLVKPGLWAAVLEFAPDFLRKLIVVSPTQLLTPRGQISVLYLHIVPLLVCMGWALGRGSQAVAGRVASGQMELLVASPLRRLEVMLAPGVVMLFGAVVMGIALWLGTWLGLVTIRFSDPPSPVDFIPGALNLMALTLCLAGITTLISSFDQDRWRPIWGAMAVMIIAAILKLIGQLMPGGEWIGNLSFLTAFEPQRLILEPNAAWSPWFLPEVQVRLRVWFNLVLVAIGVLTYAAACVVFIKRDIPVPR